MPIFDTLTSPQKEIILKHLDLVIEANEKVNLTRITTPEEGRLLHVEDSLAALEEMTSAPPGRYGDLGSGGGFPGIPLAVVTGRQTTLIDSRQKKMVVLDDIIEKLGLQGQVETYAGRAELLARNHPSQFSVLTARALAKLPVLLELASPLLEQEGWLICYKAQLDASELADAEQVEKLTGMKLNGMRSFVLGDDVSRTIVTFRKSGKPSMKLPRQEGQAQSKPLHQRGMRSDRK